MPQKGKDPINYIYIYILYMQTYINVPDLYDKK